MPPDIFEVGLKVNTKVYLDVLKRSSDAIRSPVADPGCGSRTRCRPTSPKRPRLGFRRSATTLYPSLTGLNPLDYSLDLNPLDYFVWSYVEKIPTWPPTTLKPAWSPPSAEYSPSSRWRLRKGMLSVPDSYRGGDWGRRRLYWIDISSTI